MTAVDKALTLEQYMAEFIIGQDTYPVARARTSAPAPQQGWCGIRLSGRRGDREHRSDLVPRRLAVFSRLRRAVVNTGLSIAQDGLVAAEEPNLVSNHVSAFDKFRGSTQVKARL